MHVQWFFLFFFLFILRGQPVVHELGSYERTEDINKIQFKYKFFFDDNETIKDFFVNDQVVGEEEFQKKKFEAHEQELQALQERLKKIDAKEREQLTQMRAGAYIKLIKQVTQSLEVLFKKVYEVQLKPFWAFQEATIADQEMLHRLNKQLVPSLAFVNDVDAAHESIATLKKLLEKLEQLYQIVSQFYQETIKIALEQSDDPNHLKKLLELAS